MTTAFVSIDLLVLDRVHGGQDAEKGKGNIGVTVKAAGDTQIGLQGEFSRSNYAKCADTVSAMAGSKPSDIRANCGLPSGEP